MLRVHCEKCHHSEFQTVYFRTLYFRTPAYILLKFENVFGIFTLNIFNFQHFLDTTSKEQPAIRKSQQKQWRERAWIYRTISEHICKYILLKFQNFFGIFTSNIFLTTFEFQIYFYRKACMPTYLHISHFRRVHPTQSSKYFTKSSKFLKV